MRFTTKILLSLFVVVSLLIYPLVTPIVALADGMVIMPDPHSDKWDYLGEDNQQAFIEYEDGLEKMILSIGVEEAEGDSVWIFPVPAEPEKVVIDILTNLPQLRGEDVIKMAKSKLSDIKKTLWATQIYTIPYLVLKEREYKSFQDSVPTLGARWEDEGELASDVIIYEHLEKEGITTEIITAQTAEGLYQYLQDKDLNIELGSIPVLDNYIGKEFTFVVSWISKMEGETIEKPSETDDVLEEQTLVVPISPPEKVRRIPIQKGVFVTFPTEKIYYPLLPTSVYESKIIPTTIRIMGFVSPQIFRDIKSYTEVGYFIDDNIRILPVLEDFYGSDIESIKYTKIEINAPSKMLTDDLWIDDRTPLRVSYASFISQYPATSTILLLILSSLLAGLLAGVVVFREARRWKGLLKFGLLGLSNCFSIIGLIIATLFTRTREMKEEERRLLTKLSQKGFSTWTIQLKDSRKLTFIPLFSISFLIISWVIVELIRLNL